MKHEKFYHSPKEGFLIVDSDDATDPKYYGYENMYGEWIILKDTGGAAFTYAYGTSNYSAAWTGRAGQTYADPSVTFSDFKD